MAAAPRSVRLALAVLALTGAVAVGAEVRDGDPFAGVEEALGPAPTRDLTPYEGLGTWVDAFDYGPAYTSGEPAVTPDDMAAMADAGVRTLYLQANRDDDRSPAGWVDRGLVDRFVAEAHEHDVDVVAWYLPTFRSVATDLGHLQDLLDYRSGPHRFDGVAVDIEYTEAVTDTDTRNARLLALSRRLDRAAGADPVGAIVLPPVLTEVVNPDFWPRFPWSDLAGHYDVWLPMSYWTDRTTDSGYRDGARYHRESTERLRANLGDDDAVVHGIGGIGDEAEPADVLAFAEVLRDTGAVGGSMYDWATLDDLTRTAVEEAFLRYDYL